MTDGSGDFVKVLFTHIRQLEKQVDRLESVVGALRLDVKSLQEPPPDPTPSEGEWPLYEQLPCLHETYIHSVLGVRCADCGRQLTELRGNDR